MGSILHAEEAMKDNKPRRITIEEIFEGIELVEKIPDVFNYHEIADRIHIICGMIDDFVIGSVGMTEEMNDLCEESQKLLYDVMCMASEKETELSEKKENICQTSPEVD